MGKMTYYEMLQHPNWQKKRLEILEREEYTCQSCGDKETTLHVHHGYYDNTLKLWEYDGDTLWCYCSVCHDRARDEQLSLYKKIAKREIHFFSDYFISVFEILDEIAWAIFGSLVSKKKDEKTKYYIDLYKKHGGTHGKR
jgi:hypothetical protein